MESWTGGGVPGLAADEGDAVVSGTSNRDFRCVM
jgi:hypothetical protein